MAPSLPAPERVLIVKPSSLGDVITAIPVLAGLRRSFPAAHIAWLVVPACADILTDQPGLDEIILFDRKHYGRMLLSPKAAMDFRRFCRRLRDGRFDWVIDLQGLFRSGFLAWVTRAPVRAGFASAREMAWLFYTHRIETGSSHTIDRNIELVRGLGVDARPEDFALAVDPSARVRMAEVLRQNGLAGKKFVVLVPGTRWQSKTYPPRRWQQVVSQLQGQVPLVLVGAPDERELCQRVAQAAQGVVNLAGQTSLRELAALMAQAALVVCCDSSANFIAPAVGTPFVTLMGPTDPHRTGPYLGKGQMVQPELPCLGCLRRQCEHASCMELISPEAVASAIMQALAKS